MHVLARTCEYVHQPVSNYLWVPVGRFRCYIGNIYIYIYIDIYKYIYIYMQISTDMCISEPGCPLSMHLRKAIMAIGLLREVDVIGFLAAMHVFARLTSM